jgi:hypothetical protein
MKKYGGVDIWIHVFLTSELVENERSVFHGRFTARETDADTQLLGGVQNLSGRRGGSMG